MTRLLARFPISVAVAYTAMGTFPLFLAGAYGVRLQEDLGFGKSELGYAVSGFFVVGAVAGPWLGPFIDRTTLSAGLRISSIISSGSAVFLATLAGNWALLAVGMGISGLANAVCQMTTNRLLMRRAGERRQGIAFGIKQAAVPVTSLLAGVLVSLIGIGWPWERTFLVFGGVALLMAVIAPHAPPRPADPSQKRRHKAGADFPQLFTLAVAAGFGGTTGNTLALLAVDAFVSGGLTEATAARVLAVGSGVAAGTRILIGRFIDHRNSSGYPELIGLFTVGTIGFGLLAIAGDNQPLLFAGVSLAFSAGWGWNGVLYFTAVRNVATPPATATGFALSGTMVGTILGPPLVASLADHVGYGIAWGAATAMIALGAATAALSRVLHARRVAADAGRTTPGASPS